MTDQKQTKTDELLAMVLELKTEATRVNKHLSNISTHLSNSNRHLRDLRLCCYVLVAVALLWPVVDLAIFLDQVVVEPY